MQQPSVIHSTFVIERSFPASPERVFAAFADPTIRRRWFGEASHQTVEAFEQDFTEGGAERLVFQFKEGTPFPGMVFLNEGRYIDIQPGRRIVSATSMSMGGRRISASLLTFELLPTATGTDLICTHQGAFFEGSDGPEMRQQGWQTLLDKLGTLLSA